MGLAGPLKQKNSKPAKRLASLEPPAYLGDLAALHWRNHAQYMSDELLLTEQTAAAFGLTCDLYERIRLAPSHRERMDNHRVYLQLAKQFRLVPVAGPGAPEVRHENKKEFSFA